MLIGTDENGLVPFPAGASAAGWHDIEAMSVCEKKYQYARVRRVVPVGAQDSLYLRRGLGAHVARAQFLADGVGQSRWLDRLMEYAEREKFPKEDTDVVIAATRAYIATFGALDRKPLAVEYTQGPVEFARTDSFVGARTARLDAVEEFGGGVYINELKTTSQAPANVYKKYALSGQIMLQILTWGEKETKLFGRLEGVILEVLPLASRYKPARFVIPLYEHQLIWFRSTLIDMLADAASMNWNSPARRRLNSCAYCPYLNLCQQGTEAANGYEFADGTPLTTWTPSGERRVEPWI